METTCRVLAATNETWSVLRFRTGRSARSAAQSRSGLFGGKITDRVAFRLAPRVEKRRSHHEVLGVQQEQARDQIFLVFATRPKDIADILAHRLGISIGKAEDYDRFVARDGEDIERNPGRVVLVAACIEIEEDAGRDGLRLGSEPDDLVGHDLEVSIQKRPIEPSLIHEGGVSGHHVLDGHHSGKLRLVPAVDAGFDALLVHGLGTDGGFH
jgi:hypothetical protein